MQVLGEILLVCCKIFDPKSKFEIPRKKSAKVRNDKHRSRGLQTVQGDRKPLITYLLQII